MLMNSTWPLADADQMRLGKMLAEVRQPIHETAVDDERWAASLSGRGLQVPAGQI